MPPKNGEKKDEKKEKMYLLVKIKISGIFSQKRRKFPRKRKISHDLFSFNFMLNLYNY